MRRHASTLLAVAVTTGALAMTAGPGGCSDGSAHAASAAHPHTFDQAGDTYHVPDDQVDIRAAWVGVHAAPSGEAVYTAHMKVGALHDDAVPGGAFYGMDLLDTTLGVWIGRDGATEFGEWGVWATAPVADDAGVGKLRDLQGSIDHDSGVLSVVIPPDVAPPADEVRTTEVWPRTGRGALVETGYGIVEGVVVTLDGSQPDGRCTAVLDGLPAADS